MAVKPHFEGHAAPLKKEQASIPIMNQERKLPMVQDHGALSSILTSPKQVLIQRKDELFPKLRSQTQLSNENERLPPSSINKITNTSPGVEHDNFKVG